MPFVFTVEDGSGLPDATSYVSVAAAEDYFAVDANAAAFLALTTDAKQLYLAWGTRLLDQKTDWKGDPATTTQALRWPRTGVSDRDSRSIPSDIVPTPVAAAACELARWLMTNNPTADQDIEYIRRVVVDVVEIEYQEDTVQVAYPSIIASILSGLGSFNAGRRAFSKIARA